MSEEDIEAIKAPLIDHLIELRSRLIKALIAFAVMFVLCFVFAKDIYNVLVWPFVWVAGPENSKFIYTALLEYFVTQLKLAMFGAAFLSFPVVAAQIYMFVAPGLYRNERKAFLPYLIATPFFFTLGATGGLFPGAADADPVLAAHAAAGHRERGRDRAVAQGRRISVADDVAGARLRRGVPAAGDPDAARPHRLITADQLKAKRRYFIVGAFILAAVLTPPDVISQMSLAVPLMLLYEGSIWSVRIVEKRAKADEAAKAAAEGGRRGARRRRRPDDAAAKPLSFVVARPE